MTVRVVRASDRNEVRSLRGDLRAVAGGEGIGEPRTRWLLGGVDGAALKALIDLLTQPEPRQDEHQREKDGAEPWAALLSHAETRAGLARTLERLGKR